MATSYEQLHAILDANENPIYHSNASDGTPGACRENVQTFLATIRERGLLLPGIQVLALWHTGNWNENLARNSFRINTTVLREEEQREEKRNQWGEHFFVIDQQGAMWDPSASSAQQGRNAMEYMRELLAPELVENPEAERELEVVFVPADIFIRLQYPYPENLTSRFPRQTLGDFLAGKPVTASPLRKRSM